MNLIAKLKKLFHNLNTTNNSCGKTISIKDDAALTNLFGNDAEEVRKNLKVIYNDRRGCWDIPVHPYASKIQNEFSSVIAFMKQYTLTLPEFLKMKEDWATSNANESAMLEYNNAIAAHYKEVEDAKRFVSHVASKRHLDISFGQSVHIDDIAFLKHGRVIAYVSMS